MTAEKIGKNQGYPKKFYFVISNVMVVFVCFLLLRSKVKADAINDLQYCGAKTASNTDMFVKYGPKVNF